MSVEPSEWDDRRLCPDGACVGVIGDDGRCRVCRTVDEGAAAHPARVDVAESEAASPDDAPDDDDDASEAEARAAVVGEAPGATHDADFDPDRRLCPDGACIGVLGADGSCRLCGKRGEG